MSYSKERPSTANVARIPTLAVALHCRLLRLVAALLIAVTLAAPAALAPRPVHAYVYNCVNVVLREPYWGQYRRIVESAWNAAGMGTAFARHGFLVDNAPSAGAIMVWPANYFGASSTGHVGVVAAVYGNGTVLVRHENWPFGSPEHAQVMTVRPGHQFVHVPRPTAPLGASPLAAEEHEDVDEAA